MKKMPPIEKVYEAWTAIADGRVKMNDGFADVASSDGSKSYVVRFKDDTYSSDDNATYWQGYAGYPVIAVLMLQGRLPYDSVEAQQWKEINWTEINNRFKRDYSAAVKEIESQRNINPERASEEAEKVMKALEVLPIVIKRKIK